MVEIGTKIRTERKNRGLTLQQLAQKVGISLITLQRIETGKSSPSVVLLSEIAQNLKKPIISFFDEIDKPLIHIKRKDQQVVSTPVLKVKLIGPRKMIANNVMATYGELKKGKSIDLHRNSGIEWAYHIEGKGELKLNGENFLIAAGDSVSYNAKLEHSLTAIEKIKFFGIYIEEED